MVEYVMQLFHLFPYSVSRTRCCIHHIVTDGTLKCACERTSHFDCD